MEKSQIEDFRRELKDVADRIGALRPEPGMSLASIPPEAYANVTIAFRHLEDASMRLGKVIQALDGGVSVYDKTQVPR